MNRVINKVLVANRGEIALRVMRTAKDLGIKTVAVYSEADAESPFVQFADQSACIGPPQVQESYLHADKILKVAQDLAVDAIHPGYGFLSENSAFAQAVEDAGITFIGPSAHAIDVMGDKARSKRAMIEAGVPCVPGYQDEDQSDARFIAAADEIGFPVMVKAAAGGGGRGMRLVDSAEDLEAAIATARSEAENAFGSGELILEKAVIRPRHVEVQVFADNFGNTIHLGERDCSVQRRHQKVVEEAPCPVMTPELRDQMGQAAVDAAKAVSYRGAGTVEFLLAENGEFYFLEMNTRLQVEHPVTELVTGLDLVAMQLDVAAGKPLAISQEDVDLTGHAIEVRLYAEDPAEDFLPSTGPIHLWHASERLRIDDGIVSGGEVSPYYDSMVAKVISYGGSREEARRGLIQGLGDTALFGPANNRDFLIDVLDQPSFVAGEATTALIAEVYGDEGWQSAELTPDKLALAGLAEHLLGLAKIPGNVSTELRDWSSSADLASSVRYAVGEEQSQIVTKAQGADEYIVEVADRQFSARVTNLDVGQAMVDLDGVVHTLRFHKLDSGQLYVATENHCFTVTDVASNAISGEGAAGTGVFVAPMHGVLLSVDVSEGQSVSVGDRIAVLEAMKMQHEILADVAGVVTEVSKSAGTQLAAEEHILTIEVEDEET